MVSFLLSMAIISGIVTGGAGVWLIAHESAMAAELESLGFVSAFDVLFDAVGLGLMALGAGLAFAGSAGMSVHDRARAQRAGGQGYLDLM